MARGLVAGDEQQQQEGAAFAFGQRVAVDHSIGQQRDDIGGRVASPRLGQSLEVLEHLERHRAAERQESIRVCVDAIRDDVGVVGVGVVDDLIGPVEELRRVIQRDAHDLHEHADGQLAGQPMHDIELAGADHLGQQLLDQRPSGRLVAQHGRPREGGVHQLAQACVTWRIGLEHGLARDQCVGRQLLDLSATQLARVRAPVLVHRHHVGPARQRPEPGPVMTVVRTLVHPRHRCLAAEAVVCSVRDTSLVHIVRHDVELDQRVGPACASRCGRRPGCRSR